MAGVWPLPDLETDTLWIRPAMPSIAVSMHGLDKDAPVRATLGKDLFRT
jgi:hypothetical protein